MHIREAAANLEAAGVPSSKDRTFKELTTFRVGGPAWLLAEPDDAARLQAVGRMAFSSDIPLLVLGRGSNVLVSDHGYEGIVVRLGRGFTDVLLIDTRLSAGAATALPQLANRALRHRLSGLEFTIAIPASVGGGVRMNAGAHGRCIADVLEAAEVMDLRTGTTQTRPMSNLDYAYRHSNIGAEEVVVSATFGLSPGDESSIRAQMQQHRDHRASTQPVEAPNAGSMFTNPIGDSAGRLIEACGLKGTRCGGAEVSAKHANFFLAREGSSAQDVFELLVTVQSRVKAETGVLLVPEVRIVGHFDRAERLEVA